MSEGQIDNAWRPIADLPADGRVETAIAAHRGGASGGWMYERIRFVDGEWLPRHYVKVHAEYWHDVGEPPAEGVDSD